MGKVVPIPVKTRTEWAEEITVAWRDSFDAIIKIGRLWRSAQDEIDHGRWLEMLRHDLGNASHYE